VSVVITLELALSTNTLFFEGKTCLLYYVLILCIIRAQPIVFQNISGDVFLASDKVQRQKGRIVVPGDDVLALVDADGQFSIPHSSILDSPKLRVLLTSSPGGREDQRWLTQTVQDTHATYVMEPWSREELLVTSFVHSARLIRVLTDSIGCS
jgi:hypothetical protein